MREHEWELSLISLLIILTSVGFCIAGLMAEGSDKMLLAATMYSVSIICAVIFIFGWGFFLLTDED